MPDTELHEALLPIALDGEELFMIRVGPFVRVPSLDSVLLIGNRVFRVVGYLTRGWRPTEPTSVLAIKVVDGPGMN